MVSDTPVGLICKGEIENGGHASVSNRFTDSGPNRCKWSRLGCGHMSAQCYACADSSYLPWWPQAKYSLAEYRHCRRFPTEPPRRPCRWILPATCMSPGLPEIGRASCRERV